MKLLANENFPLLAVQGLRDAGHDVLWASSEMQGASDDAILQRAKLEESVVVTFDKDFGELAFRFGLRSTCGNILFRLRMVSPAYVQRRVIELLANRNDWSGHFFVVEESRIRVRPLP